MNWQIVLANVIVFLHVLFVGIVVLSVPAILVGWWRKWTWVRNFWFRLIHLLMITIVVVETVFGVPCPLSVWERDLRLAGGQLEYDRDVDGAFKLSDSGNRMLKSNKEYEDDFVARLLRQMIMFNFVPDDVLVVSYYCFGVLILLTLFLVPPRWPWK
jgi:Protein of Unknown function (DUF2784)